MENLVSRLLSEIKKRERARHIVVIGDVMVDRWVHGYLAPCQDDCQKFVQESFIECPGGAANAAESLRHWPARVSLFGYTSYDCPVKTRYVAGGIVFRADNDGPHTRSSNYASARALAIENCRHADAVLLSDYDKGFLTPAFIQEVVEVCKDRIPVVADCKREPDTYKGCILKGNQTYWSKHKEEWLRANKAVVTYGELTPEVVSDGLDTYIEPNIHSEPFVSCINHVGAGDCFAAHLTLSLGCGFTLKYAAALAHCAGRVYVQHPHNRPPYPTEVSADLDSIATSTP